MDEIIIDEKTRKILEELTGIIMESRAREGAGREREMRCREVRARENKVRAGERER